MRISVEDVDYADLLLYLPAACRFIDQAIRNGGTVLVHDVQGLSRSATVVAAYRKSFRFLSIPFLIPYSLVMCTRRINVTQALEVVRRGKFCNKCIYQTIL